MKTLDEIERKEILDRLRHFQGDKAKAAATLGISLKTLYNKLNRYAGKGVADTPRGHTASTSHLERTHP